MVVAVANPMEKVLGTLKRHVRSADGTMGVDELYKVLCALDTSGFWTEDKVKLVLKLAGADASTGRVELTSFSRVLFSSSDDYEAVRAMASLKDGFADEAAAPGSIRKGDGPRPPTEEELAGIPQHCADQIESVLFSEAVLQLRARELAAEISRDFAGEPIIVVGLLTGAFQAVADIARHLTVPNEVDFVRCSSYGNGTTSSGVIKMSKDLSQDATGKSIVIIEDLIDTGNTLAFLKQHLLGKGAKCVKICCVLDKKARRKADVRVDYVGFDCPDEFVVGYGMDFAEAYRTMPFVGILRPEAYAKA